MGVYIPIYPRRYAPDLSVYILKSTHSTRIALRTVKCHTKFNLVEGVLSLGGRLSYTRRVHLNAQFVTLSPIDAHADFTQKVRWHDVSETSFFLSAMIGLSIAREIH